jgi:hypothetical protein
MPIARRSLLLAGSTAALRTDVTWPHFPRDRFIGHQTMPTAGELLELRSAVTGRLNTLPGRSAAL